ncbi:MAG: hypothetical protein PVF37_17565 [Desulfobacterales bacterium]
MVSIPESSPRYRLPLAEKATAGASVRQRSQPDGGVGTLLRRQRCLIAADVGTHSSRTGRIYQNVGAAHLRSEQDRNPVENSF